MNSKYSSIDRIYVVFDKKKKETSSFLALNPEGVVNCMRLKFAPVSNMALICGEGPPSILLPHGMQFRSEQLN